MRPLKGGMLLEEEGHWGQALSSCLHSTPDRIQCDQHLLPPCFSYRDGVYLPSNCKPQQALFPLSSCRVFFFLITAARQGTNIAAVRHCLLVRSGRYWRDSYNWLGSEELLRL